MRIAPWRLFLADDSFNFQQIGEVREVAFYRHLKKFNYKPLGYIHNQSSGDLAVVVSFVNHENEASDWICSFMVFGAKSKIGNQAPETRVAFIEKIIENYPGRTNAYLELGNGYWSLNNRVKAGKAYKSYVDRMKAENKESLVPAEVWQRAAALPVASEVEILDGWLRVGTAGDEVIKRLGKPKKGRVYSSGGRKVQNWDYSAKGIGLQMESTKGGQTVLTVRTGPKSTMKTSQGIGIRSSEKEVLERYIVLIDKESTVSGRSIVLGPVYEGGQGTVFTIKGNRVSGIFVGAMSPIESRLIQRKPARAP